MLTIKTFTFNPIQENTYCISDNQKNCFIIDPGCLFPNEQEQLKNYITSNNLKPTLLLLTHAHLDHIFGLQYVADTFNLIPYIHPEEKIILDNLAASSKKWGFEGIKNYTGNINFIDNQTHNIFKKFSISIFNTPGHSPGSVSYYFCQQYIFSGDVLFLESIGRTDLFLSNHEQLQNSIKTQLFTLPDNTIVFPGHGNTTSIGHEKKNNPFISK